MKFIRKIFLITFTCLFLSSCYKKQDNIHNPYYVKAQNFYSEGNYNAAIEYFNKYLKLFPDSSKANYNLASIYIEQENYIMAIFHLKKYLELEPNSPDKEIIEKWIISSEASLYKELGKEFSTTEILQPINSSPANPELEEELLKLKQQNEQMRDFILRHKNTLLKKIHTDDEPEINKQNLPESKNIVHLANNSEPDSDISKIRFYKVKYGDTLYKISSEMYGSNKYYKLIWETNKEKLKSPSNIKPGDILTIPPATAESEQRLVLL